MAKAPVQLRQGSIVIAPIVPDAGITKPRPAVVLTPTDVIPAQSVIDVIGVTASFFPDQDVYVELPSRDDGRIPTGFRKRCAAKLTLVQRFPKEKLQPTGKHLPRAALEALLARLKAYAASHPGSSP